MESNTKRFEFSGFTRGLVITTTSIYAVVSLVGIWQLVLGILYLKGTITTESPAYRYLFQGVTSEGYSTFVLALIALALAYCILGIIMTVSSYIRAKNAYLEISGTTVTGLDMPEPAKWKKGTKFSVGIGDIVSTGIGETRLYGRTHVDTLVLNTMDKKYTVPALKDAKEARSAIEKLRR